MHYQKKRERKTEIRIVLHRKSDLIMGWFDNVSVNKIELLNVDKVEDREVKVTLSNGTEVHIVACYESWQQYGGTTEELGLTVDIAERYNAWLHGEEDM